MTFAAEIVGYTLLYMLGLVAIGEVLRLLLRSRR